MNRRMILYVLGKILRVEAILLLFPFIIGLIYHEKAAFVYLLVAFGSLLLSFIPGNSKPRNTGINAVEGFVMVALGWILLSLVGCIPFIATGEIPNFLNAFFETVSGINQCNIQRKCQK